MRGLKACQQTCVTFGFGRVGDDGVGSSALGPDTGRQLDRIRTQRRNCVKRLIGRRAGELPVPLRQCAEALNLEDICHTRTPSMSDGNRSVFV